MQNKEKAVIKALPERFQDLSKKKNMTIKERFELFSKVIEKAFEPVVQQLAQNLLSYIQNIIKSHEEGKELTPEGAYLLRKVLPLTKDERKEFSIREARLMVKPDIDKTKGKLILLENATLQSRSGGYMEVTGEIFGSKIRLSQQEVYKTSSGGTPFVQFPARIYLDGEFVPEKVYKEWFKQRGSDIFNDIEDIRSLIHIQSTFSLGEVFVEERKVKKSDMKEGELPIQFYEVVGAERDALIVRPLQTTMDTVVKRFTTYRKKRFKAFFTFSDKYAGSPIKWELKATPTKSTLVGRRNTKPLNEFWRNGRAIERQYDAWRGFEPTYPLPPLPQPEDIKWTQKGKFLYTTINDVEYSITKYREDSSYYTGTYDTKRKLGLLKTASVFGDGIGEMTSSLLEKINDKNFLDVQREITGTHPPTIVKPSKKVSDPEKPSLDEQKKQYIIGYEDGRKALKEYAKAHNILSSDIEYKQILGYKIIPDFDTPEKYQEGFLAYDDRWYDEYKNDLGER